MHFSVSFFKFLLLCCLPLSLFAQNEVLLASRNAQGLYGYTNAAQEYVIEAQYDLAFPFQAEGIAKVVKNGLWGLIDPKGKNVVAPQYEYIGWADEAFFRDYSRKAGQNYQAGTYYEAFERVIAFRKNGLWGLMNTAGKVLAEAQYDFISYPRNRIMYVAAQKAGAPKRWGLLNLKGKEVLPPRYEYLSPQADHKRFVVGKEQVAANGTIETRFGVIDATAKELVKVQYSSLREMGGYYVVKTAENRWQLYNAAGSRAFIEAFDEVKYVLGDLLIAKKAGRWGVVNLEGKWVIAANYQDIQPKDAKSFSLLPFTNWRLVNLAHEKLKEFHFEDLQPLSADLFKFQLNGLCGIINYQGEVIEEAVYQEIFPFKEGWAVAKINNRFTVIDSHKQRIVSDFDSVQLDTLGFIRVKKTEEGLSRWGLYKGARQILPPRYEGIKVLSNELFAVKQSGAWGYMNAQSLWVVNPKFDDVAPYVRNLAVARLKGRVGIIDRQGKWLVEPVFDSLYILSRQVAIFKAYDKLGLLHIDSKEIKIAADKILHLGNGLVRVENRGYIGIYHVNGDKIIPPDCASISECSADSVFTVYVQSRYKLINQKGKVLLQSSQYDEMRMMSQDFVPVRKGKSWGFISQYGKMRISMRYGDARPFTEGLAAVKMGNAWGYISRGEILTINPDYDDALPFQSGLAQVRKRQKWGFINTKGREVVEIKYDTVYRLSPERYIVMKDGLQGLVAENKGLALPTKYQSIRAISEQHFLVERNNKKGISGVDGKDYIPMLYDFLYVNPYNNSYLVGTKQERIIREVP